MSEIVIRIQVPEGTTVDVEKPAPLSGYVREAGGGEVTMVVNRDTAEYPAVGQAVSVGPACRDHGPMTFKSGTSKAGKPYKGYFCETPGCTTTPVWS